MPFFAIAQSNYKPGYVLTASGDTIKGFINYKDWGQNPKEISFKKELNIGRSEIYTTTNANGFVIAGYESYIRYKGKISQDLVATNYLTDTINTSYKTDVVFLKTITSGKYVNLYQYVDAKKTRYFISEEGSQPTELIYHKYLNSTEGGLQTAVTQAIYRSQLQSLAAKYQPQDAVLPRQIDNADYTAGLKKIIIKLNGSTATDLFVRANDNKKYKVLHSGCYK